MSASEQDPAEPALRPDALPADTSIRFVLLVLSVSTASLYLFQALWFAIRGQQFAEVVARCAAGSGPTHLLGTLNEELQRQTVCRAGVSRGQAVFAITGALVVLAVAWVVYRLRPRWRERRSHLTLLDAGAAKALLTDVDGIAAAAGLPQTPRVFVDAANPGVQAFVYGAGNDLRIGMTGGLAVQHALDPPGFTAVVRHELGHVANRDVPYSFYTVSVWWAFLGAAVIPVVVVFMVSDPTYVLRLGWRTALLALLVAVVSTGLLRTRESYADARAAEWGSRPDLERLLGAQRPTRSTRPAWLRTHPEPVRRRQLLVDTDGLFAADWIVALTTGVAAGTAFASLQDITYLLFPNEWSVILPSLTVAVPIAVICCVQSWRVGLREAVRGDRRPLGLPVGVGLGVGLAFAPLLTIQAAAGGFPDGARGWEGYVAWAVSTIAATVLVVRWVADAGRMRVTSVLADSAPRRALAAHIALSVFVFALQLAVGSVALTLLSGRGLSAVPDGWLSLPMSLGTGWLARVPVLVVLGVILFGLLTRRDLQRTKASTGLSSTGSSWFWSGRGPGDPAPLGRRPPDPPSIRSLVWIGIAAATASAVILVLARIVAATRDAETRASDSLLVAIAHSQSVAVIAAAVAGSVGGAAVTRGRWWPLGLVAGAVGAVLAGTAAVAVNVAAGCGVFSGVRTNCSAPTSGLVELALVDPATRASVPAFLAAAAFGLARALRMAATPRAADAPARSWRDHRTLIASGAVLAVVVIWAGAFVPEVLRAQAIVVAGPGYRVAPSLFWHVEAVDGTDAPGFVTDTEDVTVIIAPGAAELPPAGGARLSVGGREAWPVGTQSAGAEEIRAFEVRGPGGVYLIVIRGTATNLDLRADEVLDLLERVRWVGT